MNWLKYIVLLTSVCLVFPRYDAPDLFQFNQTTLQAAYFFTNVTLNGNPIEPEDWVGAFCGDICVGAKQWNTAQCGGGTCEVVAMGNDGSEYTEGYCTTGDIPTFKIYDASENVYLDATPSEDIPWSMNGFNNIDSLISTGGCTDSDACNYNPDATEDDGSCLSNIGNLSNCTDGTTGCDCNGDCGGSAFYDHCYDCVGGNTIYPPGDAEDVCGICDGPGLGTGAYFTDCWDLNEYCYSDLPTCENQLEAADCIDFNYCPFNLDGCNDGTVALENYINITNICVPDSFSSVQSSLNQAYYYFQSVIISGVNIAADDWVGAFNGNVCVGAQKWDTSECLDGLCEVVVMGYDNFEPEATAGYMQSGDIPTFKIYDASGNTYYDATPSADFTWSALGTNNIENLTDSDLSNSGTEHLFLDNYSITNVYPNPFNPITIIKYGLPENAIVELTVFNIYGRHIQTLVQGFQTAGYYSIHWNASNYPSGVYLIRLESGKYIGIQKISLIK